MSARLATLRPRLLPTLRRLLTRVEGQDLIEYALLIGVLALATITVIVELGPKVSQLYSTTVAALNGAPAPDPGNGNPGNGNPGNGNPGSPGNPGNPANPGNPTPGNPNPGKG